MKKIVVVAGDKSGDCYGGMLCQRLKALYPDLELYSFGGEHLSRHSRQIINLLAHSVTGIFEVLRSLPKIIATLNQTAKEIESLKPDLVILIDFPDFNLRLAKKLNKKYPIFYYVSPQVWAWRKQSRLKLIRKYVNLMVPIFKFEEEFYRLEGIEAKYFGHPLLEIVKKKNLPVKKIISFMPGSRRSEIAHNLPVMLETKKVIAKIANDYAFRIIRPENIDAAFYLKYAPDMETTPHSYEILEESELIITASGTATVEITILEVPFIIIYRFNPLTWLIAKTLVRTEHAGMVNILAGKRIIYEFLQDEANPLNISAAAMEYLVNAQFYQATKEDLRKVKEKLLPGGATENFAKFIGGYLKLQ